MGRPMANVQHGIIVTKRRELWRLMAAYIYTSLEADQEPAVTVEEAISHWLVREELEEVWLQHLTKSSTNVT